MAHEVEMIDGVAQMAYAGAKPWHGLGVEVSNDLTPAQMQKKAGLDWEVEKMPLSFTNRGGKLQSVNKHALVRSHDSKVLDVIGDDWNPVQNTEAFEFFSEYVLAGDMEMNTAGSLKGGKNVLPSLKLKSLLISLDKTKLTPIYCLAILTNMVKLLTLGLLPFVLYAIIH